LPIRRNFSPPESVNTNTRGSPGILLSQLEW